MGSPLDRFIPQFDIRERFEREVNAPAAMVLDIAKGFDLQSIFLIRLIIRVRKFVLRGTPDPPRAPVGLLQESIEMGWGILEDHPKGILICGAYCQPWIGDVKFVPLTPDDFRGFAVPDFVKIAWTIETEQISPERTNLIHEVRAVATDEDARVKFLKYWRWARFGIIAIRVLLLPAIRRRAELEWRTSSKHV